MAVGVIILDLVAFSEPHEDLIEALAPQVWHFAAGRGGSRPRSAGQENDGDASLDHRHALDVAVHPDSEEGRALIEYLERHGIPFLAFRGFVPGASTGAHVHVGRVSARIAPTSSLVR